MSRETDLLSLVDGIYAAADDPGLWPGALGRMADLFDVRAVNLLYTDGGRRPDGVMVNHGLDPDLVSRYNAYYVTVDPIVAASLRSPIGEFFSSEALYPGEAWRNTELYADLMGPYGLHHLFGATLLRSEAAYGALSMMRAPGARALDSSELELFGWLVPHVQRAMAVHRRLCAAEHRAGLLTDLTDELAVGVILLDECGRVMHANAAAERMARAGDGLLLGPGGVKAALGAETTALRRLVVEAVQTGNGQGLGAAGAMRLTRSSLLRPYEVLVTPLSRRQQETRPRAPVAALFVTDPEAEPATPEQLLAGLYGLTRAEARLAAALLRGATLDEISVLFGVTMNTVRTQLRSVFAKTETRRQSDLVRTVLRGPVGGLLSIR